MGLGVLILNKVCYNCHFTGFSVVNTVFVFWTRIVEESVNFWRVYNTGCHATVLPKNGRCCLVSTSVVQTFSKKYYLQLSTLLNYFALDGE